MNIKNINNENFSNYQQNHNISNMMQQINAVKLDSEKKNITNFCLGGLGQLFCSQPTCGCQQKYKETSRFEQVQKQENIQILEKPTLLIQSQQKQNNDHIFIHNKIYQQQKDFQNIYDSMPICLQRQNKNKTQQFFKNFSSQKSYQSSHNKQHSSNCLARRNYKKYKCAEHCANTSNNKSNNDKQILNNSNGNSHEKINKKFKYSSRQSSPIQRMSLKQLKYKQRKEQVQQVQQVQQVYRQGQNKIQLQLKSYTRQHQLQPQLMKQNVFSSALNNQNLNKNTNFDHPISFTMLKEQDLLAYAQILQKRNLTILAQLQSTKNKNSHLSRLLQIFISQKQIQLFSQQKNSYNKIVSLQEQKNNIQQKVSHLQLKNQKLQAQNRYLKELIISANKNYQSLEQKNVQINNKYLQLLEQRQLRQNQFKLKVQELKNIFQKVLKMNTNNDQSKYQQNLTQRTKVEIESLPLQQKYSTLRREPLKERNFQRNNNHTKMNKNQLLDKTKHCTFGTAQQQFQQQSFKQTKQRQKQSVDQNYRKIFLKTLSGKGKK